MTPVYQSVTLPAPKLRTTANTTTSSGGLKNRTLPIENPFSSRGAEQFPLLLIRVRTSKKTRGGCKYQAQARSAAA